jgi:hypothetical protein
MKNKVNDKDVTGHIFEYTTQIVVDTDLNVRGPDQGFVPVQILFCLKEKNAKKVCLNTLFVDDKRVDDVKDGLFRLTLIVGFLMRLGNC